MSKWLRASLLGVLGLAELLVCAAVHLAYGFYIFSTAVAGDLSQALVGGLNVDAVVGGNGGVAKNVGEEEAAVLDGSAPPIVLVHGIFGFGKGRLGGLSYFAGAEKKDDRVLVPDLGSLTSVHDRARELFYYLKGGRVDYGEEHSRTYGHSRFGRAYARGHYPVWDEEHPVHLVGHSAGAQVIRLLQLGLFSPGPILESLEGLVLDTIIARAGAPPAAALACTSARLRAAVAEDVLWRRFCADDLGLDAPLDPEGRPLPSFKAFEGYEDTSENWVLSVTSLSGALNGTTRAYLDGMQPEDGKSLKPVCLLQICRVGCILYHWLDVPWLKRYYDFGFDHFGMSWREAGVSGLADLLAGAAGPFATGDWILLDLTIQGAATINARVRTFPCTFYFSYASRRTARVRGVTMPSSVLRIHPLLFIRVMQMCRWSHPAAEPPCKDYRDEDWENNDGALNTISMTHPRIPVEHPNLFVENDSDCHPLQPGIWYYKIVEADHMTFVINRQRGGVQFDLIYDSIFQNCRKHVFRTAPPPTLPNQS